MIGEVCAMSVPRTLWEWMLAVTNRVLLLAITGPLEQTPPTSSTPNPNTTLKKNLNKPKAFSEP